MEFEQHLLVEFPLYSCIREPAIVGALLPCISILLDLNEICNLIPFSECSPARRGKKVFVKV